MRVLFNYYYCKELKHRDEELDCVVEKIRKCRYAKAIKEKRSLVRFAVSNNMTDRLKNELEIPYVNWTQNSNGYTGLVTVTLPFGENLSLLKQLRETVNMLQQVMCSYVGVSGRTLKVIVPYTLLGSELSMLTSKTDISTFHKVAHANAVTFLLQITGVKAVGLDADVDRGALISADEEIYYNPQATPIPIRMPEKPVVDLRAKDIPTYSHTLLPDYDTLQMQVVQFNMICRKLNLDRDSYIDEQILHLANECRQAGIPEEVAVKCSLALSDNWRKHELLVRTSFENAYSDKTLRKQKALPATIFNQMLLRDFLKKCYFFRRNVVTGSCEYMERNKYISTWKPLNDIALNSICLAAQTAGIDAWDKDLRRYVGSDMVQEYDPIAEWLYGLPTWDGQDRVGDLAKMVTTDTPNWTDNFHIWMRSMVNQWMNRGGLYGSSLVLMLIGGQGTGKSTFCKRLIPDVFLPYYNDRLDFSNKKDADRALMRFVLICLDEYDQISRSHGATLKNILQKSDVMFRKMYQDEIEQRRRYATFCATTNVLTPLTDPTGSRRYLCVNITGDIDTKSKIDYEQLYAQLVYEIRHDEPCYLDRDEERRIQEYNLAFYNEQQLETIIEQCVRVPLQGEESKEYTSLELLQMIKSKFGALKINKSVTQQVGFIMAQKGFPRRRLAKGWVYSVVEN